MSGVLPSDGILTDKARRLVACEPHLLYKENHYIPPWGVVLHISVKLLTRPASHAPPSEKSLVNEVKFLGLIPKTW